MITSSTSFLTRLSQSQNSWIQHRYLKVIRTGSEGSDDPETVLERVRQRLYNERDQDMAQEILKLFEQFPQDAWALAAHNIEIAGLSLSERKDRKQKRAAEFGQGYLSQQQPTERQTLLLQKLNYTGPIESKQHASDLIKQLLNNKN